MAVSNEAIMNKMMAELQQARASAHDKNKWRLHIAHIQLLSELLLDNHEKINEPTHNLLEVVEKNTVQTVDNEQAEDEDGTSIFDF